MAPSIRAISDFASAFKGNSEAYGVHIYQGEKDASGKIRGTSFTETKKVTSSLYEDHLKGGNGLGIVPVTTNGTVFFSVIDVDVYNTEHLAIIQAIYQNRLPLLPFRSKSGGLHLYLFYKQETKAADAIEIMNTFKALLGFTAKTETFPKQAALKDGGVGNWINLPYYNADSTCQYLMSEDGKGVPIEVALASIETKKIDQDSVKQCFESLPVNDGPPCLQSIYLMKRTSFRNNYLFNIATYYKAKVGEEFENEVIRANLALLDPIEPARLDSTVLSSQKKKSYAYTCTEEPICNCCSKTICKKRKYGIASNEISELTFGEFTQVRSDPPTYEWIVNGKALHFFTEEDVVHQDKFRRMCLRELNVYPAKLSDSAWTKIINTALVNIAIRTVDATTDISQGNVFQEYLTEFMTKRAPAKSRQQLLVDRVYFDETLQAYVFRPKKFLEFLINTKQFRLFGIAEIQYKLRERGAQPVKYTVDKDHAGLRFWALPKSALEPFIEAPLENISLEFMEELSDEPY